MKILLWNVRGARKPSFRSSFSRLLQLHHFDICVLLETRLSGDSLVRLRRQIARSWSSYAVEAEGLSGGMLAIWRPSVATIDAFHQCNQHIGLIISEGASDPWLLSAVYASTDYRERRVLWSELTALRAQGIPSIIAGDFNCIAEANEKRGGRRVTASADITEFRSFIASSGLMDLGFSGPQFTWCNNRQGTARVWERLDRALASSQWLQRFPAAAVTHLPRIASDHCPILISTENDQLLQKQFRFEKFWTGHSAARSIIAQIWHVPVRGDAVYRLSRHLKMTRHRLSRWNRLEVGNLVRQIEKAENDIIILQTKEDQEGSLGDSDLYSLRGLLAHHHALLRQQEVYWWQRSRFQWISDGDRNTRFFHQTTLKRRAANRIRRLVDDDGHSQEDIHSIRDMLLHFFKFANIMCY